MVRVLLLAPLVMFGATAALAQSAPPAVAPVATTAKPVKEKLICENQDQIGSRLGGHRMCKTAAQWAEERQQNRMMLDRAQTQRACSNGTSGC